MANLSSKKVSALIENRTEQEIVLTIQQIYDANGGLKETSYSAIGAYKGNCSLPKTFREKGYELVAVRKADGTDVGVGDVIDFTHLNEYFVVLQRIEASTEADTSVATFEDTLEESSALSVMVDNDAQDNLTANKKVIILNKPFLGEYIGKDGKIGHEIIDYLRTDSGEHYIYNLPGGTCPDNIWVEGTSSLTRTPKEEYCAKYLLLTSSVTECDAGSSFDILFVIELDSKLHRLHNAKKVETQLVAKNEIKLIIRSNQIKYNGVFLDKIYEKYNEDAPMFVTFKANRIFRAVTPIHVEITHSYRHGLNGYLYSDCDEADYNYIIEEIENAFACNLEEYIPPKVNAELIPRNALRQTFMDLISATTYEQLYTNMLYRVLSYGDVLYDFCQKYKGDRAYDEGGTFSIYTEEKIVKGRMDICAESSNQRVIIENKINSGLNGLKADCTSQLSTYYEWGIQKAINPLCFVLVPDHRKNEIQREILQFDPQMATIYSILTYGEVARFLSEEKADSKFGGFLYSQLLPQIIDAFNNWSVTKEELFIKLVLDATNNS